MMIKMLKSKIHRATVTEGNVHYEGSITIDQDLMESANMIPYESISIWNVTNGSRLETYVLPGARGSGIVSVNGASAHLNKPGDVVILASFVFLTATKTACHKPIVIHVNDKNRVIGFVNSFVSEDHT